MLNRDRESPAGTIAIDTMRPDNSSGERPAILRQSNCDSSAVNAVGDDPMALGQPSTTQQTPIALEGDTTYALDTVGKSTAQN
jgi:hypothetical protein